MVVGGHIELIILRVLHLIRVYHVTYISSAGHDM